eukprot:754142-Hanusia_phi.AAC.1
MIADSPPACDKRSMMQPQCRSEQRGLTGPSDRSAECCPGVRSDDRAAARRRSSLVALSTVLSES